MSEVNVDIWTIRKDDEDFVVRIINRSDINGEKVRILFSNTEELCKGKKYGIIYDATDFEIGHISRSAYAENMNEKLAPNRKGEAFVFNSLPIRMIISFYHKMFKPPYPSGAFKSLEEAKKWMKTI